MTLPMFDAADVEVDETTRDSWCTPQVIVDALLVLWPTGIDLDPCSNAWSIVPAATRWGAAADGLARKWYPGFRTIYVNWPFSEPRAWVRRCVDAAGDGAQVVGCGLCDPSVSWWREIWTAQAICFPERRMQFRPPPGIQPSSMDRPIAIPYWGDLPDKFDSAFGHLGKVVHL